MCSMLYFVCAYDMSKMQCIVYSNTNNSPSINLICFAVITIFMHNRMSYVIIQYIIIVLLQLSISSWVAVNFRNFLISSWSEDLLDL